MTTSHPLEWLQSEGQTTSIGENVKKLKPSYIPSGNLKWCSHDEKHVGNSSNC